ncbi:carboxylesterase family protein [Egbenema bharatensis]|uniref:carboxylesterase family protein n=1 Tax=Egbenema bharatensis TaxID=3463334 RepID=UPI003A891AF2
MRNRRYAIVIIISILIAIVSTPPTSGQGGNSIVQLDSGAIEGSVTGEVLSFKGIPYAAPPVNELRWQAPQPVAPWEGVRPAIEYGDDCIQLPLPGDAAASGGTMSEDCLVLNVWRPAAIGLEEPLPVLVWIHGGGFVNGSAAAEIYDGSAFAQQGLVVVSFNYRLGRLGFFAHPALTAAEEGLLGNYGLLDQLAALQWVQRNISALGGNPDQVTMMGESAGGISVMHHLTSPASQGLFHQAIVLSGGGRTFLGSLRNLREGTPELPSAEVSGIEFARSVGITTDGTEALEALQALPAEQVNGDLNMLALLTKPPTYAGGPIFDGELITAMPGEILRQGEAANVPILIGTTSADLPVTFPPLENPFSFFGAAAERAIVTYNPDGTLPPGAVITTIAADITMHEPARFVARQMRTAGNPAWLYRFGYVAESLRSEVLGAEHASELPYLFDTLDARYGEAVTESDRAMAQLFHTYFANFAKSGDPNGEGLPPWTQTDSAQPDLMMFTLEARAVMAMDPWNDRLDLVEQVANDQTLHPPLTSQTSNAMNDLGGTSWQLVQFQSGDGTVLIPDDPTKYTITFTAAGQINMQIDCNRGRGTWISEEPHQLVFGPLATTRALCPPGSLFDRIVQDWEYVRSYTLQDGHLFLSLMADGGTYEFAPIDDLQSTMPR